MLSDKLRVSAVIVVVAVVADVPIFNVIVACVVVVVVAGLTVPVTSEGSFSAVVLDILFVVDEDDTVVVVFLISLVADTLFRSGIVDTSTSSLALREVVLAAVVVECWVVVVETPSIDISFVKEDKVTGDCKGLIVDGDP